MAEIRKFKPGQGQSAIAKALEETLGAAVRPVTPGEPQQPVRSSDTEGIPVPPRPGVTVTSTTSTPGIGWTTTKPVLKPKH